MPRSFLGYLLPTWRKPTPPPASILRFTLGFPIVCGGYQLAAGLTLSGHPDVLGAWTVWTALTVIGCLLAATCIPGLTALQRAGYFCRPGWPSWFGFYGLVLATCMAGAVQRLVLGPILLPVPLPQASHVGLAINLTVSTFLIIVLAELYNGYFDHRGKLARQRQQLAVELERAEVAVVGAEDSTLRDASELLHGEMQSRTLLAWLHLGAADRTLASLPAAAQAAGLHLNHVLTVSTVKVGGLLERAPGPRALRRALEDLAEHFRTVIAVRVDWPQRGGERLDALAPGLADALVHLVEECLANAVRHGHCRRARVEVDLPGPGRLRVRVVDDGSGLAVVSGAPGATGLGSRLREEHLRAWGGTHVLQAGPGGGTVAAFEFPMVAKS